MQFFNTATGLALTQVGAIALPFFNGGIAYDSNGTAKRTAVLSASDIWIGGLRVSASGELVTSATVSAPVYNNGVPCSPDAVDSGAILNVVAPVPGADDPLICGGTVVMNATQKFAMSA